MWVQPHANLQKIEIFPRHFLGLKTLTNTKKGIKKIKIIFFGGLQLILGPESDFCRKSLSSPKLKIFGVSECFQVKIYRKSFGKNIFVGPTTRKSAKNPNFPKALSRANFPHKLQKRHREDTRRTFGGSEVDFRCRQPVLEKVIFGQKSVELWKSFMFSSKNL